jgi:cytochrome c nitrite reductase small subunit
MTIDVCGRIVQYLSSLLTSLSNAKNGLVGVAHSAEIDQVHGVVLRWGTTLDWAIAITAVTCLLILAGIFLSLILFRGRQTEGNALWLHLLVLGILPMFLLPIGNFTMLEYAKEESNCNGCHLVLQPYVDDMRNPMSGSLAALHFQDRFSPGTSCYSCHTNYGVHGSLEGKMAGLGHALRYLVHKYELPLKIAKPFSNSLCLKCHHGAKRFMAQDTHLEGPNRVSTDLIGDKVLCVDCHKPAHRVRRETTTSRRTS